MDIGFKIMLVSITLILGSIGLRVDKKTVGTWWFASLYAMFGGAAGFWFGGGEPVPALAGAAAGAVSMYIIRPALALIRQKISNYHDPDAP